MARIGMTENPTPFFHTRKSVLMWHMLAYLQRSHYSPFLEKAQLLTTGRGLVQKSLCDES